MPKNKLDKDEQDFQAEIKKTGWFKEYVKEYGEEPNLNTSDYDYRAAWKAGVRPVRDPNDKNRYHWSSSNPETGEMLKSKDHPTAWKEDYMRATGKNPDEVGVTREQYREQMKPKMRNGGSVQGLMRKPSASELEYFKQNPTVSGMATDDNRVILNPYSKLTEQEKKAVALNETARIKMRTTPELKPNFDLTPEQTKFLDSNTYKQASDEDRKATIAARILSGDPSAGTPTDQQLQFVETLKGSMSEENAPTKMAMGGSVENQVPPTIEPPAQPAPIIIPKFDMAKGGAVAKQTQRMLKEGGMMQEGGTVDPVSGNDVPVGAMQEEVRDDIPAQLSEGEFVFPADVVRYIGLERLMMMRQAAKKGLGKMEDMGQMSNAEEATEEDTGEFESQIDEIIGELGGREPEEKEEDEEEEDVEMAVGGMATDPAVMEQTQQALAQDQQAQPPQAPALTEQQLAFIQQTAEGMKAQQTEVPPEQQSMPTEGLKSVDIIRGNLNQSRSPEETDKFLNKVARLEKTKKMINIRHNDTVILGFVKSPGVVDPVVFTQDDPVKMQQAIEVGFNTAKKAGIKRLESSTPNPPVVQSLKAMGYDVQETNTGWGLDL